MSILWPERSSTVQTRSYRSPLTTHHHPWNTIPALYPWPSQSWRVPAAHTLLTSRVTASSNSVGHTCPWLFPRGASEPLHLPCPLCGQLPPDTCARCPLIWTHGACSTVTSQRTFLGTVSNTTPSPRSPTLLQFSPFPRTTAGIIHSFADCLLHRGRNASSVRSHCSTPGSGTVPGTW